MREKTPLDNEILRKATLRYLVAHHPGAFDARTLAHMVHARRYVDWLPTLEELTSALSVLADLRLAEKVDTDGERRVALGASVYWKASAQGVLEQEREDSA